MSLKIVMMATGEFALPAFKGLYETHHQMVGLYTQPDRTGRGHHTHANLLKEFAREKGTNVFQPSNINKPNALETLRSLNADIFVVAAYGQILSSELLGIPRLGAINLHGSILPRHRGAAPVHYAILSGDKETGVTIFQIEPKVDAGGILGIVTTKIASDETTGVLHDRLAELSFPLLSKVLTDLEQGKATRTQQEIATVTLAPKMTKAFGQIDWNQSAFDVANHIRAMDPWPSAFTFLHRPDTPPLRLIVTSASLIAEEQKENQNNKPGQIIVGEDQRLLVQTKEGAIEIHKLRPAGKREMTAEQFLNGHTINNEYCFGE